MSDIHLPIDYSNLKAVIPPGEDIIYSTLCIVIDSLTVPLITKNWLSHVLLTTKGLAYTKPKRKKSLQAFYVDWNNVKNVYMGGIRLKILIDLRLARDPIFESNEAFIMRKNRFRTTIKPVMEKRKKEWELKVPNKMERNTITKNRKFEMDLEEDPQRGRTLQKLKRSWRG